MNDFTLIQMKKKRLLDETVELKRKIYSKYSVGGVLHIVLDDGNLKNHYIEWCIEKILKEDLPDYLMKKEDKDIFLKCASNMLEMSMSQRLKVWKSKTM